jgi:hypothetical protein
MSGQVIGTLVLVVVMFCPVCAPEFYHPLADGEAPTCPTDGCGLEMEVYSR